MEPSTWLMVAVLAGASGAGAASPAPAPASAAKQVPAPTPSAQDVQRAQLLLKQGDVMLRDGRYQAALPLYRRAVKLDGTSPHALKSLGRCLARMGKFGEAAIYYRRFLEVAPNDPDAPAIREGLQAYDADR